MTEPPAPGGSSPPTGRSRRRPSSRSRPAARCGRSTSATSPELGFELVLGNTFHLFLAPGAERIAELGGLHRFTGWDRAIITDSGGFQVFSLAHGNVADEIKGRRGGSGSSGGVVEISERGVAFRSYLDGSERFMGPEESMAVQAALGSDIALAFDECTPYHADRDYTARSTERTHRWLDRCLAWHDERGPRAPGRVRDRPGRRATRTCAASRRRRSRAPTSTASRSAARSAATSPRCTACSTMTVPMLPADAPKHLLGIGEPDDLLARDRARHRRLRLRGADAPRPSRDGARPAAGLALSLRRRPPAARERDRPAGRGLPLPDLRRPQPRLPALPGARRGPDGRPPADPPQPHLPANAWSPAPARAIEASASAPTASAILAGRHRGRPSSHRARPDAEAQKKSAA